MEEGRSFYVGVDVGTSSVRAALVTQSGKVVTVSTHSVDILEPQPNFYEQSSENIWQACCSCIQSVCAGVPKEAVRGVGFDATCSLVVLDHHLAPVSVSPTENPSWNVIMWLDHRAEAQAEKINKTKHKVLQFVGGSISLEMQMPKLLWLKENAKHCWDKAAHFLDLPDFLTWRATGSLSRSLCSLVCKWTYQADADGNNRWDDDFFSQIGLPELSGANHSKIGSEVLSPGSPCGSGLTPAAAADLGLLPNTPVSSSLVDAHAGGLGCLACTPDTGPGQPDLRAVGMTARLALICGTSTCHMAVSERPLSVPGVWGPYYSAMVPGLWLNEGGQSATGKLLDHIIESHPAYNWIKPESPSSKQRPEEKLQEVLEFRAQRDGATSVTELTGDLHVWPDYHGNRSPVADPTLRGMMCGLSLSAGVEDLAVLYLATVQALAYGTRHILDKLTESGHQIKLLFACGGLAKNSLYIQTHADVTGLPVVLPAEEESVLLGSAILAAAASGDFPTIQDAMSAMAGTGNVVWPTTATESYHSRKYQVFKKMLNDQQTYKNIMRGETQPAS